VTVGVIWAQSRDGVIGRDGGMPWHVPEDSAYFRRVTTGHPVIMGRLTWESLPDRFRPLPGRRNIVISRRPGLTLPGAEVVGSLDDALRLAGDEETWVVGGGQVYAEALPLASVAEVSEIDVEVTGDVHAPSLAGWTLQREGEWQTSTTGARFRWLRYIRPQVVDPVRPV
jgi:dihydrofolate reductase